MCVNRRLNASSALICRQRLSFLISFLLSPLTRVRCSKSTSFFCDKCSEIYTYFLKFSSPKVIFSSLLSIQNQLELFIQNCDKLYSPATPRSTELSEATNQIPIIIFWITGKLKCANLQAIHRSLGNDLS